MYLKSIEVNGFKSFANKIDFKFEKGITGIVGPNGSGKSNVADAVRWVLGEQSASKLRGSKMEDVIFSGTQLRKPQASAYVAITLDNSDHSLPIDYNEVTVARRVYRSGESEYLLNGNVQRLKDITRMFFDTGIGKEGYSIIGQGQIEKILSDKPDDRRALFDEAAGIVKYKKNKAMTEKNLEAEHVNLNRVNDILSGLEERVEPLRIQSEKAAEYLSYKDRLKTLDINSFLLQIDKIREKISDNEDKLGITETDIKRLTDELEFTKTEYEKLEEQLEALNSQIEAAKDTVNEKNLDNERADGEIRVIKERISSEDTLALEINGQIGRYNEQLEKLLTELQTYKDKKSGVAAELKELRKESSGVEAEKDKLEYEELTLSDRIEQAKADIIDIINEGGNLKEKIARYDAMLDNIKLRRSELQSRYLADKNEEGRLTSERNTLTEQQKSVNEAIATTSEKIRKTDVELSTSAERLTALKNSIQKYNQNIYGLKSRYETLRNLTERYEGYGSSIKKVMEQKSRNKRIVGVVADIIEVDAEYETAIETALGGSIQNIITEDSETAKEMIAYLRTNKLGRATFLPISDVSARGGVSAEVLREPGVIGVASELVRCDKKYKGVIQSLLGRSIVVKDIDTAIQISRKYNRTLRLVTPKGDLINPGGAMTGGAFRNSSNLLGRKRELDEITKEIGENNNGLRSASEEATNLQMKRESLKEQKQKLSESLQKHTIDQNSISISLKNTEDRLAQVNEDLAAVKKENDELDNQVKQIDDNKVELSDTGKQHESQIADRRSLIEKLEGELSETREKKLGVMEKLSEATLRLNSVEQSVGYINTDIERVSSEADRVKESIADAKTRLKDSSANLKTYEKSLQELSELKVSNDAAIAEALEGLQRFTEERDSINRNHKDFFGKREEISNQITGLEKSAFTLKMTIEKLNEERDTASNYMWEEYELTYSSAEELKDEELSDPAALKKEISAVRQKIKSLGEVNVGAIEEYKEVSERYQFLKGQRDDIIEAENNLKGIIADLDEVMKSTFREKFADIQDMFGKVFKELFGGGKATLELVDEENILETGIIINAQPPGKKLQNMMQLSGGEKSLTAIALLFAIQSLKPSPFCILDEIEAALDDSNIDRFAKYLNKLTKNTQFIVITHRKGTMEAADVLYGITMQEKGVSTLVSVNLIESKLDD